MCQPRLPTGWNSSIPTAGRFTGGPLGYGEISNPPATTCCFLAQLASAAVRASAAIGTRREASLTPRPFALRSQSAYAVKGTAVGDGPRPLLNAVTSHRAGPVRSERKRSARNPSTLVSVVAAVLTYPPESMWVPGAQLSEIVAAVPGFSVVELSIRLVSWPRELRSQRA